MISTRFLAGSATTVLLVSALTGCGSTSSATAQGNGGGYGGQGSSGQGSGSLGSSSQGGRMPGTSGEVSAVTGRTAQVQGTSGQVAVSWTAKTTITSQVATKASAVKKGVCVMAMPKVSGTRPSAGSSPSRTTGSSTVQAATVRIVSTSGSCSFGGGANHQV